MQSKSFVVTSLAALFVICPSIATAQPTPPPQAPPAPVVPAPVVPVAVVPVAVVPVPAAPVPAVPTVNGKAEAAKIEKSANEIAQGNIDALRTGKLIASGLTGGVAFTVQLTGPFNNNSAKQVNPKGAVMPYIMALPGYWGARQATREACASAYSGAGEDTIDSAARAIARKRATRIVSDIESSITAAGLPAADATQIATDLSLDYGKGKDDRVTNDRIVKQIIAYMGNGDADTMRKISHRINGGA